MLKVLIKRYLPIFYAVLAPVIPGIMLFGSFKYLSKFSDFPEYYTVSWMVTHGCGADIYNLSRYELAQNQFFPQMSERIVGFYLAPMAVPLLLPVHLLPLQHSFFLWFVFLFVCLLVSIFLLVKGLKLSFKSALMIWAFICISGPAFESLRIGQIGPVLLLSYSAFILCERLNRPWLSAIALLPFLCKPHLLLPQVAFLAGGRRYRELIVLLSMAVVLLLSAFYMIGFEGLNSYYNHVQTNLIVKEHITPTLRDQIRLLFPAASSLMNALSLPVYLLAILYLFRQARVAGDSIFERSILMSMPAALLFSPYVHVYDWLLLTPSVIVFFVKGYAEKLPRAAVIVLFLALAILFLPAFSFIHHYYLVKGGIINPFFWVGLYFWVLLCCLPRKAEELS